MGDFYEIMDFCGFDLEKANQMVKDREPLPWMNGAVLEAMDEVGLETLESKSAGA